jgi:uncharacterized membrane protein (UPF0127 family)
VTPQTGLPVLPLVVERARGEPITLRVELARTPAQQAHGMMGRLEAPPGTGMLFPRSPPQRATFWMRDTPVALDMIFIGPDRRIESIVANVAPLSDAMTSSKGPVIAVLELGAGEARRLGISVGDRVRWTVPPAPKQSSALDRPSTPG